MELNNMKLSFCLNEPCNRSINAWFLVFYIKLNVNSCKFSDKRLTEQTERSIKIKCIQTRLELPFFLCAENLLITISNKDPNMFGQQNFNVYPMLRCISAAQSLHWVKADSVDVCFPYKKLVCGIVECKMVFSYYCMKHTEKKKRKHNITNAVCSNTWNPSDDSQSTETVTPSLSNYTNLFLKPDFDSFKCYTLCGFKFFSSIISKIYKQFRLIYLHCCGGEKKKQEETKELIWIKRMWK